MRLFGLGCDHHWHYSGIDTVHACGAVKWVRWTCCGCQAERLSERERWPGYPYGQAEMTYTELADGT